MFRHHITGAASIGVIVVLAASACAGDESSPATTTVAPATTTVAPATTTIMPSTSTAPTTLPAKTASVLIYGLRNELLTAVGRSVAVASPEAAVSALFEGFTAEESTAGITTLIPAGTTLNGVVVQGNEITLDLSAPFDTGGGTLSVMGRVSQTVFTATQFSGIDTVRFWIDGAPVTELTGEGFGVDGIGRSDLTDNLVPLVLLEHPYDGQQATQPIHISGMSNTFEATVFYEIESSAGEVLSEGYVMATSGTGTWGTFDADLPMLPAGTGGSVTLRVFDRSGETGDPVNVVEITVNLG